MCSSGLREWNQVIREAITIVVAIPTTSLSDWKSMANTKTLSKEDRKTAKRTARKKAAPKAKRTVPRGSAKRKMKKMVRGTAKR